MKRGENLTVFDPICPDCLLPDHSRQMCSTSQCLNFIKVLQKKTLEEDEFEQLNQVFHSIYGSHTPARQGIENHAHAKTHFGLIKELSSSNHPYAATFMLWRTNGFGGFQPLVVEIDDVDSDIYPEHSISQRSALSSKTSSAAPSAVSSNTSSAAPSTSAKMSVSDRNSTSTVTSKKVVFAALHSKRDRDVRVCNICGERVASKDSNTSNMERHLRLAHKIVDESKVKLRKKSKLESFLVIKKVKAERSRSFRECYGQMVARKYLPFSMIEDDVVQESYIAFAKENGAVFDKSFKFISRNTVKSDIDKLANEYIEKVLYI